MPTVAVSALPRPVGRGAAPKEERAQLKTRLANMSIGSSMTVGGKSVERRGAGQWVVEGTFSDSPEKALTAIHRPDRRAAVARAGLARGSELRVPIEACVAWPT